MNREGVGLADAQEAPELKKLWRLSFPEDTEEGVAFFFQRVFQPLNCVVFRQEGRPVSMAFLLPAVLHTPEGPTALHYLYAAATRPDRRGRGLFARVLCETFRVGRERGVEASCLLPAEQGLAAYYARFGYRPFFRTVIEVKEGKKRGSGLFFSTDAGEYALRRNRSLSHREWWVEWPPHLLAYAVDAAVKNGGGVWLSSEGVALCEPGDSGSPLLVREFLCHPAEREEQLRLFSDAAGEALRLRSPVPQGVEKAEDFGMLCPLTERARAWNIQGAAPYLGLAFD